MDRRKFLQQLGLGSLAVAAATTPIIAAAVDASRSIPDVTKEDVLNQTISIWRYKIMSGDLHLANSTPYMSKTECEWALILDTSGWSTNPVGALKNWAYKIQSEGIEPNIQDVFSEEITLKHYLSQALDKQQENFGGYLVS